MLTFGLLDTHNDGESIIEAAHPLDRQLSERLRFQGRRAGVTSARLFHAAWALTLAQLCGRDDVIFGTVLSIRSKQNGRATGPLGMAVNTLPLRLKLAGLSVPELLQIIHQQLNDLTSHQHASLTLAQSASGVARGVPLFTSILNYRRSGVDSEVDRMSTAGVRVLARGEAWTSYPVALMVDDLGANFVLTAQVDRRIDPTQLMGYFEQALLALTESLEHAPQTPALSLPILPKHEQQLLIEGFNDTVAPYSQDKLVH